MVIKPPRLVARGKKGLIHSALKVRGREYLRIIYGPDYDAPENPSSALQGIPHPVTPTPSFSVHPTR